MRFRETKLKGVLIIETDVRRDERGFFARTFDEKDFEAAGLPTRFAQNSTSSNTKKGIIRGMHFQLEPKAEGKLVRCPRGRIHDVVVDIRRDSPTYLQWISTELSGENCTQIYIPPGLAHGYQTLTEVADVYYQMTEFFDPALNTGARWNDPAFDINWPLPDPSLSEKDRNFPDFKRS